MSEDRAGTADAGQDLAEIARPGTFGRIVLDLGLLTPSQLKEALEIQKDRQRKGDFARLGHILVDQGFLTPAQVQQVLQAQKIVILTCSGCEAQYNIRGFSEKFHYECPKCHSDLKTAEELKSVAVQDQLQVENLMDTVRLTRPEETNTAKIRMLRRLGRYEILGEIARGGMGIIYKARQLDLERIVALKTLRQEELGKPEAAKQFIHEAKAVASLRHPNIVAVHEVGTHDGIEYFTMEFIEGLPLDRMLMRSAMKPEQAARYILPIAEALHYAHSKGVVHRDLKPANIIVAQEDETPFLVDFGIAQTVALDGPRKAYDEEEDLLGSIPYMAPEYVEGAAYDEGCDLYSLGVVLYEALAGANSLPYYDDDTRKFLELIVAGRCKSITTWVPDLDPSLVKIVDRMIAARAERYASMAEVVAALRRWLERQGRPADRRSPPLPQPTLPPPPPLPDPVTVLGVDAGPEALDLPAPAAAPPTRHNPAITIVVACLAALALVGLALTRNDLAQLQNQLTQERARAEAAEHVRQGDLAEARLEHAQRLVDLKELDEAHTLCTEIITALSKDQPTHRALAGAFELRGKIRARLERPGAEDDLLKASRIRSKPKAD